MIPRLHTDNVQGCDAEEKYTAKMLSEKLDRQSLIGASPLSGPLFASLVSKQIYHILLL